MSKCESNVNELIVSDLVGIPGTVSSRLADFRDWRGDASADVSELEIAASVSRHRPTRAGMASHDEVCGHGICRACAER